MNQESKRELYLKIKDAREAVAGSDIQSYKKCVERLKEAERCSMKLFAETREALPLMITNMLIRVEDILHTADLRHSSYEARLVPDQKLCDLLNGSYFSDVR